MEKRLWSFLAVCLMTVSMAFAQSKVTGIVIESETGEPVVGASVLVKGTQVGAATDINGKFTINNVPHSSKLLMVSYIGMVTKEVVIKPNLKIYLDSDAKALAEQIVIAYGTATKETFTGSATVVGADMIAETQKSNALDALNGKAAGVQLFNASGQPGESSPTIRIRGISSINASNAPLIVLDGAVYTGDIGNINPADIESMSVLKDAASNALYGARAANGVIMITTKKAQMGTPAKITVDAKWGSNHRATRRYKTINNPALYYEMYYKSLKNQALKAGMSEADAHAYANNNLIDGDRGLQYNVYTVPDGQDMIGTNGKLNPLATMGRVVGDYTLQADDWLEGAYKNGFRQEYNVTATQATATNNFYSSFGYLKNEGITANSSYERITGRLKADAQIKPWLKVGANASYAHYDTSYMDDDGTDNSSGNIFAVATQVGPIYPLYMRDANGNIIVDAYGYTRYDYGDTENAGLTRPVYTNTNALSDVMLNVNSYEGNAFNGNVFGEIKFLKDFKFISSNSLNLDESRQTNMTNAFYGTYSSQNGLLYKYHTRRMSTNYEQRLAWGHEFGDHSVDAMVAHESNTYKYYYLMGSKTNMFSPENLELAGAVNEGTQNSYTTKTSREAWVGRAQYNYMQKYFGSVSLRREASSVFHPDHRWGTFWSASAAWLINKEAFFDVDWVDMLKLKVSYGQQGNDGIGSYLYTNRYSIVNASGEVAVTPSSTMGNKEITWEKQGNFNVGVDFELFGGRLNGNLEYFYRKTSDMLFSFPYPASFGYTSQQANIGDMRNQGWELELDGDVIRTKDWTWNLNANITTYTNKITRLPEERRTMTAYTPGLKEYKGFSSGSYFYAQGKSLYSFYMQDYVGVYSEKNYVGNEADVNAIAKAMGGSEAAYAQAQELVGAEYNGANAGYSMWYMNKTVNVLDAEGNQLYYVSGDHGATTTEALNADGEARTAVTRIAKVKTSTYSNATQYVLSPSLPKFYGGFGTSLRWKDIDFSINFAFQIGGKCLDSDYQYYMNGTYGNSRGRAMHADMLKAWSTENQNSSIPALEYGYQYAASTSNRFLINASYLSINNINLGYTLPREITRKLAIDRLRVYVAADNVFVWSKRQGLDPRQSISGSVTSSYYAPIRTISGGLTVTF